MHQLNLAALFVLLGPLTPVNGDTESPTADVLEATDSAESPSQPTYLLQYRFEPGEVLRYSVEHAANARVTMKGTTQSTKSRSDSIKAWKILDVLPDGEIEFSHVVEKVSMRNEQPDRAPVEYDSEKDAAPSPDFRNVAAAVGVTLTVFRMKPQGTIVDRSEKHPQLGNNDDVPILIPLPKEPVAIGAEWNEPHFVNVVVKEDDRRRIETRRHFKLASVKNGIATIALTYQVLTPIDAPIEAQIVSRLASGKVRFDIDRGRITSQQLDVDRRVVGFSGPTSSIHFVSRFTERLLPEKKEVAEGTPKEDGVLE
jgi:hypothetical protein